MRGHDWARTLSPVAGKERDEQIADAARRGLAVLSWASVDLGEGLIVRVSDHAIRFGDDGDSVRMALSAMAAQLVADELGLILPTAPICDRLHQQAEVLVTPCLQTPDAHMGDTSRAVEHSDAVDAKVAGRPGLVSTEGKDWVLSSRLLQDKNLACNYGWHDTAAPYSSPRGLRLWQTVGYAHNIAHSDYSQTQRYVLPSAELCEAMRLGDRRVSDDGPLPLRYPGVLAPGDTEPMTPVVAPAQMPLLKLGSLGADVVRWQTIAGATPDGDFGPATESATKRWQSAHGLTPDGVVGPDTWRSAMVG